MNEYDLAAKIDESIMSVIQSNALTPLQQLNYLRVIEASAKLLHLKICDSLLNDDSKEMLIGSTHENKVR